MKRHELVALVGAAAIGTAALAAPIIDQLEARRAIQRHIESAGDSLAAYARSMTEQTIAEAIHYTRAAAESVELTPAERIGQRLTQRKDSTP